MGTDFDDLLAEIEGTGWYQKRLVYFLLGPLFFVVPFAFLHQIFVLAQPSKLIFKKYVSMFSHGSELWRVPPKIEFRG